jgi:hypothetical protein
MLASENSKSLMLQFDAMLGGYVGMMPVLWVNDHYADLIEGEEESESTKQTQTQRDMVAAVNLKDTLRKKLEEMRDLISQRPWRSLLIVPLDLLLALEY